VENLGVNRITILEYILKKWYGTVWTGLICLKTGTTGEDSYEHGI